MTLNAGVVATLRIIEKHKMDPQKVYVGPRLTREGLSTWFGGD